MIRVTNLDQFHVTVTRWLAAVHTQAEKVSVGIAYDMLSNMLITAPQYSGQFVASWNVSVGAPDYSSHQPASMLSATQSHGSWARADVRPYEEGDALAIDMARSRFNLAGFRLGQTIFLANSVSHDEPYSVLIEQNKIKFRPENPSGGKVVARAMQRAHYEYGNLTRTKVASLIGA